MRDRNELAEVLLPALMDEYGQDAETWTAMRSLNRVADALLASPVFARLLDQARADALRGAADEIERVERIGNTPYDEAYSYDLEWFRDHPLRNVDGYQRHRPVVAAWLRDRAGETP